MTTTTNLQLLLLQYNQAQKELVVNEALMMIDALLNNSVIEIGVDLPPLQPNLGDSYIIGKSPINQWQDKSDYFCFYYNGWRYLKPKAGLQFWVQSKKALYLFDGEGWVVVSYTHVKREYGQRHDYLGDCRLS